MKQNTCTPSICCAFSPAPRPPPPLPACLTPIVDPHDDTKAVACNLLSQPPPPATYPSDDTKMIVCDLLSERWLHVFRRRHVKAATPA